MTGLQIAVLLIGVGLVVLSFFLSSKFSDGDLSEIRKMSKAEVRTLLDVELKEAERMMDSSLDARMEERLNRFDVETDRETNSKILQISEYSDSVLSSMNKSHEEIIFMYDMLNEKQENATNMTAELHRMESEIRALKVALEKKTEELKSLQISIQEEQEKIQEEKQAVEELKKEEPSIPQAFRQHVKEEEKSQKNVNEEILNLHKDGLSEIEIAKKLGRGIGEVKLVLGLFKGGEES